MTSQDFSSPEWEVKLYYKASKVFKVKADSRVDAHKAAYDAFMDTAEPDILQQSTITDFFVETRIDGKDGSDMLHD